jgi:hypothetical protein
MITNPYNPLEPAAYFFGRDDVFAFFRQHFVGTPHDHALVLTGRRGLGKTSVLRRLDYQLDGRYRTCIISLGAYDLSSEGALIAGLADDIRLALEEVGASTYRLPEWPPPASESDDTYAPTARAWLKDVYLPIVMSALRTRYLLLALDDAHRLLEAIDHGDLPGDLLDYLGEVLAAHERLDLIVVLEDVFEDRALTIDLLNEPTLHIRLAELDPQAARQLVEEPVEGILHYESGLPDRILALAGGHPFLLHSICRLLFRRSEERNHTGLVTRHDLTAIRDAVMEQADDIFRPLWQRASRNEQVALSGLVRLAEKPDPETGDVPEPVTFETLYEWLTGGGYAINKTQLAAALRSLDYQGLIQAQADVYTLPVGLIADWVAANAGLPEPVAPPEEPRRDMTRLVPLAGLLIVLLIVGGIGIAALSGVFDPDDDDQPADSGASTATLALNLEATRQSDFVTQTEAARPTNTRVPTDTPTITPSPTDTLTPTNTPTITPSLTPTITTTPTRTLTPAPTNTPRPMRTPRPSRTPIQFPPTATPLPTLDPGG